MHTLTQGSVVWFDFCVRDTHMAITFYAALFDWKFEKLYRPHERECWTILGKEGAIGGVYQSDTPKQLGSAPTIYFSVEDLDRALINTERLGGKICTEKTEIPSDGGYYAQIVDPDNNIIGLWSKE